MFEPGTDPSGGPVATIPARLAARVIKVSLRSALAVYSHRSSGRNGHFVGPIGLKAVFNVLTMDLGTSHARFRPEATNTAEFEQKFSRFEAGLVTAA